jgi:hypothetical protein
VSLGLSTTLRAQSRVPIPPVRQGFRRNLTIGAIVLAGVLMAEVVVSAVTTRTTTIRAEVTTAGRSACVQPVGGKSLCLSEFHTAHLRLQSVAVGQCLDLTYQGSRVSAASLTGAWTVACPPTSGGTSG